MMTDEQLIERYQDSRCAAAFESLHNRYDRLLWKYLRRKTGDEALADDLLQQTWTNLHERCHQFKRDKTFRPWLFSIAANLAIDHFRVVGSKRTASLEHDPVAPAEEAGDTTHAIERALALVASLPEDDRVVMTLIYSQGLTFVEAARFLGIPLGTVKTQVSRSLKFIRRRLCEI